MDFFESQEAARRRSKTLVLYFIMAIAGIVLSIYAVIVAGTVVGGDAKPAAAWWQPDILLGTAVGTIAVILLGTGYKTMELSAGGSVVAQDLGGRRLDPDTRDFDERKLMNVVEEMAIASGIPVPEVYLLEDESSINAFAAGRTPSDAVIGVTRGCMRFLTRDELQGVIAHEFSHILNGDMRLNLRLLGLLHGILLLAIIGRVVLRGGAYSREKAAAPLMVFGISLIAIGSFGVLFGKLIKAAVSRQREFLADASAVQFTRNPDGIGGALRKIGGFTLGSCLKNPRAEEASHMFFANGLRESFASAFATHPPLDVRIRKINPHWDGSYPEVSLPTISAAWEKRGKAGKRTAAPPPVPQRGAAMAFSAAAAMEGMGRLEKEQVEEGRLIREEMPGDWMDALHHRSGAQALIFAMLLRQDDRLRAQETAYLKKATDEVTLEATLRLHREIGDLHSSRKLALIDLAIPALRRLPPDEYDRFLKIMDRMMRSDQKIDLFEFTLLKIVKRHLDLFFQRVRPARISIRRIDRLADEISILLSTLAHLGRPEDAVAAEAAFRSGAGELEGEMNGVALVPKSAPECGLDRIDGALDRIDEATPLIKKQVLQACGKTVMADERIESGEAELLRAIADTIGCPIPPFVKTMDDDRVAERAIHHV